MGAHKNIDLPKDVLQSLYSEKGLNQTEIARKYGCDRSLIRYFLLKYGIPLKSQSEACIKYPRTSFNGNPIEKAYIIGFRTGDLCVRYLNPSSKTTIHVDMGCRKNSSEFALFKGIFSSYGHIGSCKDKGNLKVCCLLDTSFRFLLKKPTRVPRWIMGNEKFFLSLLAGYIDAEGYLKLSKPPAISIETTDYGILCDIAKKLREMDFYVHLRSYKVYSSYKSRKQAWRVTLQRKLEIKRLANKLLPLSHHRMKKNRLRIMTKLINQRVQHSIIIRKKIKKVGQLVLKGLSIHKACRELGIVPSTYYRIHRSEA